MNTFAPFIAPALALFFILRRGSRPRRVKPNGLWIYPVVITVLAVSALARGKPLGFAAFAWFALAVAAGGVLGWFTTQHVELTLDEKTGTIMSKPTLFGTWLTAAVFALRFGLEFLVNGGPGGHGPGARIQHADSYILLADAGLLFVAARSLAQAGHMWIRTRPLLAQHKAAQLPPE